MRRIHFELKGLVPEMNKQISPAIEGAIAVVGVLLLGFFLYRSLQPAPYPPSSGAGGRPGAGIQADAS